MPVFFTDIDFDARILAGLKRIWPDFAWERAVDAGLNGRPDPEVLEWAACRGRILLSHDAKTMHYSAMDRVGKGLPMPGVVVAPQKLPIGQVLEELEIVLRLSEPEELRNRVLRLPL